LIENDIKKKAGFSFDQLEMSNYVRNINIPAIFITSWNDKLVDYNDVINLFKMYGCESKDIIEISENHS